MTGTRKICQKVKEKVYNERIEDSRGLVTRQRLVVKVAAEWVWQLEMWADALAFPAQCKEDCLKARVPNYLSWRQQTTHFLGLCRENPGNFQGTFRELSGIVSGTFSGLPADC
jgi:hypothetical protein